MLGCFSITASDTLPTVVRCPVCRQPNSLDVARWGGQILYRCRNRHNCGFQGDGVLLYAVVTNQDLRMACLELLSCGVIPATDDSLSVIDDYLVEHDLRQRGWLSFWQDAQSHFAAADTHVRVILQRMGVWESQETTCGPSGLGSILGAARGDTIKNDLVLTKQDAQWVRDTHTYTVMPMWASFGEITGFTVWDRELEWALIPLVTVNPRSAPVDGVGMLELYKPAGDVLFLCENPLHAVQLACLGWGSGRDFPVVHVGPRSATCATLSARQHIMLLGEESMDHYKLCLKRPDMRVCRPKDLAASCCQTSEAKQAELVAGSRPSHQALADCLMQADPSTARVMAQNLRLSTTDIARVLSAVPSTRQEGMRDILEGQSDMRSVKLGQVEVIHNDSGWYTDKHGQVLDCVFFIDRVVYDPSNKNGTAHGVIIKDNQQYEFNSPLRDVQNKTLDWLNDVLLRHCASMPICLPGWARKLFNISVLFQSPQTVHSSGLLGWTANDRQLILPHIVINDGQLQHNTAPPADAVPGQALMLTQEPTADVVREFVADDDASATFWALFCGVCINVFSQLHDRGTFGVGIVDAHGTLLGHLAEQARVELGLPAIEFSTASSRKLSEIKTKESSSPLPYYIEDDWHKAEGFRKWMRHAGDRNCLVEMSLPVAIGTSLDGGWLYIRGPSDSEDHAHRFMSAWSLLPHFIAWAQTERISFGQTKSELPRAILNAIGDWMHVRWSIPFLPNARSQKIIKLDPLDRLASRGSKILSFLIENVEAGRTRLLKSEQVSDVANGVISDHDAETLFISAQHVAELFDECGLHAPTSREVADALEHAQLLKGRSYRGVRGFVIDQSQYNFLWAIRQATH